MELHGSFSLPAQDQVFQFIHSSGFRHYSFKVGFVTLENRLASVVDLDMMISFFNGR